MFRKKVRTQPYNFNAALVKISLACQSNMNHSLILPSVYYDIRKGQYAIQFECAQREYPEGIESKKYVLKIRRIEKLWCLSLEKLLDFAISYTQKEDAFLDLSEDNLPEGVTMKIKNIDKPKKLHRP